MPNYSGLKVNRGETSSATEQNLFWVWDETFADDGYNNIRKRRRCLDSVQVRWRQQIQRWKHATLVDIRANIVHATSTTAHVC